MLRRGILTAFLVLNGLTFGWAEEPAKDYAATVARHIEQLGSRDYALRKESATFLKQQTDALTVQLLQQALKHPDREIRQRAQVLYRTVKIRHESVRRLQPTKTNVPANAQTVDKMVQGLSSVIDVRLENNSKDLAKKAVDLNKANPASWATFDQICKSARLTLKRPKIVTESKSKVRIIESGTRTIVYLDERYVQNAQTTPINTQLTLIENKAGKSPAVYDQGALRICAWSGEGLKADKMLLTFHLEKRFEWKHLLGLYVKSAIDDQGQQRATPEIYAQKDLLIPESSKEVLLIWDGHTQWPTTGRAPQQQIQLTKADKPAKMIRELRGVLRAKIKVPKETLLHIKDVKQAKDKLIRAQNGIHFQIIEVKRTPENLLQVGLELHQREQKNVGGAPVGGLNVRVLHRNRRRGQIVQNALKAVTESDLNERGLEFLDDKGQKLKLKSGTLRSQGQAMPGGRETYQLTFQLTGNQRGAKQLRYRATHDATIEVPFVLKNVPLK